MISHPLVLALASGLALALSYNVPVLWPLAFIALVPLFFSLTKARSTFRAAGYSFAASVIFMGSVFSFLASVFPLDWAGIEAAVASAVLIAAIWILSTLAFALPMSLWGAIVSRTLKQHSFSGAVLVSSLWVTLEFLGALMFLSVHSGPGSLLSAGWSFGHLGYALAEFPPLLALAAFGGVYLLSFFVVITNYALFLFIKNGYGAGGLKTTVAFLVLLTLTSIAIHTANTVDANAKQITVASVFTRSEPRFFATEESARESIREMESLTRSIRESGKYPDIILFPENTGYMSYLSEVQRDYLLDSFAGDGEVVVIDTEHMDNPTPARDVSLLNFYSSDSDDVIHYQKRLLVPQGEYLSYLAHVLGDAVLEDGWSKGFEDYRSLEPGRNTVLGEVGGVSFVTLFCSEIVSPFLYQEAAREGAEVLFNSASHAIFGRSSNLESQIIKFARVRAVENNRYFIQAGNAIPSFVVSNRGDVEAIIKGDTSEVLYATIPAISDITLYTRLGYAVPLFFIILSVVLSTGLVVARRKGGI